MNNRRIDKFTAEERAHLAMALHERGKAMRRMIESCDGAGEWENEAARGAYVRDLERCEQLRDEFCGQ